MTKTVLHRIIHRIRYKLSESYRIERGRGLMPIRNDKELKALIAFCRRYLKEEHAKLNPERCQIYELTIAFYEDRAEIGQKVDIAGHIIYPCYIHDVINEFCGWYWD